MKPDDGPDLLHADLPLRHVRLVSLPPCGRSDRTRRRGVGLFEKPEDVSLPLAGWQLWAGMPGNHGPERRGSPFLHSAADSKSGNFGPEWWQPSAGMGGNLRPERWQLCAGILSLGLYGFMKRLPFILFKINYRRPSAGGPGVSQRRCDLSYCT